MIMRMPGRGLEIRSTLLALMLAAAVSPLPSPLDLTLWPSFPPPLSLVSVDGVVCVVVVGPGVGLERWICCRSSSTPLPDGAGLRGALVGQSAGSLGARRVGL
jgi:hypothetical protein